MITVSRRGGGLARLRAGLPRVLQQEVDAASERVAAGARAVVPRKTGALMGSIEAKPAGILSAVVQAGGGGHTRPDGKPVNYAAAVELGSPSGKRPAKPYMRPAAFAEAPRFPKGVAAAIRRTVRA